MESTSERPHHREMGREKSAMSSPGRLFILGFRPAHPFRQEGLRFFFGLPGLFIVLLEIRSDQVRQHFFRSDQVIVQGFSFHPRYIPILWDGCDDLTDLFVRQLLNLIQIAGKVFLATLPFAPTIEGIQFQFLRQESKGRRCPTAFPFVGPIIEIGKTVTLVDHIQLVVVAPGCRPQEDVSVPAVNVADPLIKYDDSGKMLAIDNVQFGQRLLVDFVEAVGNELAGKLMAGSEAISEQNGILLKKWFAYVHDFERGDGKAEELGQPAGHVFIDKGPGSLDGVVFKFDDI